MKPFKSEKIHLLAAENYYITAMYTNENLWIVLFAL